MSASVYAQELCKCPFCWKDVAVTYNEHNKADGLTHELPMCKQFENSSPDQYMTALREEYERLATPKVRS